MQQIQLVFVLKHQLDPAGVEPGDIAFVFVDNFIEDFQALDFQYE